MNEFDFGGRRASEFRQRGFWALFAERHPEERARLARRGPWFWQRGMPDFALVLSMYVAPAQNHVGVFFGRNEKFGATESWSRLKPFQPAIETRLKLKPEQSCEGLGINSMWRVNCYAEDNWPAMADWLVTECSRFEEAVLAVLGEARPLELASAFAPSSPEPGRGRSLPDAAAAPSGPAYVSAGS